MMKRYLPILILIVLTLNSSAQEKKLSLKFNRLSLRELADTLEKTIPVKIFFADSWNDSTYFSLDQGSDSLSSVLNKTLTAKEVGTRWKNP